MVTTADHTDRPEIWFRSTSRLSHTVLYELIYKRELTASLRLGCRDAAHPKGYSVGQQVTLRLRSEVHRDLIRRRVCITGIRTKQLGDLSQEDFVALQVYHTIWEAQKDLSFFEGREVLLSEKVTVVSFRFTE